MLKVLIVDDEPIIRQGLREKLDWNALGFEITAEARNGEEALRILSKESFDLVLSDMKMPKMDGIQLLEHLAKQKRNVRVVVISAYSSFEYTHAAIKYGALDYILKPIDTNELKEILLKIKAVIINFNKTGCESPLPVSLTNAYKEDFLKSFLSSIVMDKTGVRSRILDMGLPLEYTHYLCLAVLPPISGREPIHPGISPLFNLNGIAGYVNKMNSPQYIKAVAFENPMYPHLLIIILGFNCSDTELPPFFESLKAVAEKHLKTKVTMGVGLPCDSLKDINSSFLQAKNALNYRKIADEGCIILSNDIDNQKDTALVYSSENEKAFLTSLEINNFEEMQFNIRSLFESIKQNSSITFRQVYKLCSELLFLSDRVLRKYSLSLSDIFHEDIISIEYIASRGSLRQLEQWFSQVMEKIMYKISAQKASNIRDIIEDILGYIHEHYNEDISLNEISDTFHISKSYFSALFKKRTNTTFVNYVTAYRINKAAELLSTQHIKVYEAAKLAGYTDVRYFSKLFYRQKGVTPVKFKKNPKKFTEVIK